MQTDEEGVVDVGEEHVSLGHHVFHLIPHLDVLLAQHLHRIDLLVSVIAHHEHPAEAALSDGLQVVEV